MDNEHCDGQDHGWSQSDGKCSRTIFKIVLYAFDPKYKPTKLNLSSFLCRNNSMKDSTEDAKEAAKVPEVEQDPSKDHEDTATLAPAGTIKVIDRGVVHQICSGQVVFLALPTLPTIYAR